MTFEHTERLTDCGGEGTAIPRLRRYVATSLVVGLGAAAFALIAWYGRDVVLGGQPFRSQPVDWTIFAVIAGLLLGCERLPITWIRFGPRTTVTPLSLFALALLLLGPPAIGIPVALLGSLVHSIHRGVGLLESLERLAESSLSLSSGALVLWSFGVTEAITGYERIPWTWAVGIVVAGLTIVISNAIVATFLMAAQRRRSVSAVFRRTLAARITAEGALLSLAPLWVIGIDFSPVLLPLLVVTTVLVFRSTREALERSHEAKHDALTSLPNRRAFLDEIDDAVAAGRSVGGRRLSVLLMDLDGFKDVNDQLGHGVGDALLIAFAERLSRTLPASASAARLGGDEFAVLLSGKGDAINAGRLADELQARLSAPHVVEGFPISAEVSIGIATYPDDGETVSDLLRSADMAMYRAKRSGRSAERHRHNAVPKRSSLSLLGEIGSALERGDLHVHFQPQVRLSDGSADTVEALVRWRHPTHGAIPPQEFIGLAEQTDLIAPITRTVLRTATRELLSTGVGGTNLAVNITPRSLVDPRFAQSVFEVLAETSFPAQRLELEITERALISHPERSAYNIEQLRAAGVRVALDDFGAGYASYQTLRLLEVDRLKIDSEFVKGIVHSHRDRAIVASLIALAHQLGFDVVGEGVEDERTYSMLTQLGCDIAQGYYIAVPMGVNELGGWLTTWRKQATAAPLRLVR